MHRNFKDVYKYNATVVKKDQSLPVHIAEVVKIIETFDYIPEDDSYHLLFEAIAKWLSRVHDVRT